MSHQWNRRPEEIPADQLLRLALGLVNTEQLLPKALNRLQPARHYQMEITENKVGRTGIRPPLSSVPRFKF
jgi:hypothetical protein